MAVTSSGNENLLCRKIAYSQAMGAPMTVYSRISLLTKYTKLVIDVYINVRQKYVTHTWFIDILC